MAQPEASAPLDDAPEPPLSGDPPTPPAPVPAPRATRPRPTRRRTPVLVGDALPAGASDAAEANVAVEVAAEVGVEAAAPRVAIGIDFGGSGIKGALVDLDHGTLLTERFRIRTPSPATPKACIKVIRDVVAKIAAAHPIPSDAPVGLGIPAVVIDGITVTAVNIDDQWLGFAAEAALRETLGREIRVVNDADAAGVGELRFGAGRGQVGTVVLVTLGTGVGTALFRAGHLVPNTELGHIEVRGKDAETRASAASRVRRKLSWTAYAAELDEYLHKLDMLIWPDLIIIGGGISKDAARFIPRLTVRPRVIAAENRNNAGIVGAATIAADSIGQSTGQPIGQSLGQTAGQAAVTAPRAEQG